MGCSICKQLKTEHYEEKAGDCWFCMGINIIIASIIVGVGWYVGVPEVPALVAWGVMMFRIGYVGYLFPDTPRWLPYIDFIFQPFGKAPTDDEMLAEFAEDVAEMCNEAYDDDDRQMECAEDLSNIIGFYHHEMLTETEFVAAMGEALEMEPEELRERVDVLPDEN